MSDMLYKLVYTLMEQNIEIKERVLDLAAQIENKQVAPIGSPKVGETWLIRVEDKFHLVELTFVSAKAIGWLKCEWQGGGRYGGRTVIVQVFKEYKDIELMGKQ